MDLKQLKLKPSSRFWHSLSRDKVFDILKTSENGLSNKEANLRLKKYGLNKLPEEKPPSKLILLVRQFKSPLIYILIIAGLITLLLKDYTDSIIIFVVVFLNTIIGFFQENKTSKILAALKKLVVKKAHVIRDGNEKEINAQYLVPGDIFILEPGVQVPADGRLIESYNLKINEASLTGEWWPKEKKVDILPKETILADRDNMVYMSTIVDDGKAKAVVTSTGFKTEIGKIAKMISGFEERKTPFQKKVSHFSKILGIIILLVAVIIFVIGILTGKGYLDMFVTSVAVAVAAIPEGLPAAVTIIFALGMRRILSRKGLVRNLLAAETLGSTSVILTDKTGTLTEAKMQVAGIFTATKELFSGGKDYSEKIDQNGLGSHITALKIATLGSSAYIENPDDEIKKWVLRGKPTEQALLLAGIQAGLSKKELEKQQPKIDELPFDPTYKYSASLHRLNKDEDIIYIMGAPEAVLKTSAFIELDGHFEKIDKEKLKNIRKKFDDLTSKALRVIAVGYKIIPKESLIKKIQTNHQIKKEQKQKLYEEDLKDLIFVGFIALKDPLRKEAKKSIEICRQAGIRPIIVTGDYKLTASSIAREIGLKVEEKNILEGQKLKQMSDENLKKVLKDIQVYARVEPAQKLKIVKAWQEEGEVVAMTGDGVNDAPALKKADIGISLGSGTEVAKEASDLILLNDNFSTIVAAVEEGRAIMDNVRKVVTFLLSSSFTEVILIGSSVIFAWPLPVLAAQILWVNLIEDSLPTMALAFEPKEKDLMYRKPQKHDVPLMDKEMKILIFFIGFITDIFILGLFYWLIHYSGYSISHIRSIIFAGLGIDSLFFIFSYKSLRKNIWHINIFSNKLLIFSWVIGVVLLLSGIYFPPFRALLKIEPLNLFDWQLVFIVGLVNLVLIEAVKYYFIIKKNFS